MCTPEPLAEFSSSGVPLGGKMTDIITLDMLIRAKYHETLVRVDIVQNIWPGGERRHFLFKNNLQLSVVSGQRTQTGPNEPFELAIIGVDGKINYGLNLIDDPPDDVVGHCSLAKVLKYAEHVSTLLGEGK